MRKILHNILLCGLALLVAGACQEKAEFNNDLEPKHGAITLTINADNMPISRAEHDKSPSAEESIITHLDVLIFAAASDRFENSALYYHERVEAPNNGEGSVTLNKKRKDFNTSNYYVYLLANYTGNTIDHEGNEIVQDPADVFASTAENPFTIADLRLLTQYDINIDLTGSGHAANDHFLMDGIAFKRNTGTEAERTESVDRITPTPLQLNDGVSTNNTELIVNLRRAAAKIVVNIKSSENARFDNDEGGSVMAYYFQHLTTQTYLVTPTQILSADGTKDITNDGMYRKSGWGFSANDEYLKLTTTTDNAAPEKDGESNNYISEITVQGYAYAHDWNNKEYGNDTRLVVNIPLWHKDVNTVDNTVTWSWHGNNYYQIPVSKKKRLDRNTLYVVNVEIDAIGSTNVNTAVEIKDVSFNSMPWVNKEINVGASDENSPVFLSLNKHEYSIFQEATGTATTAPLDEDATLTYASSSAVTVEIVNWYYENASGIRQYRYSGTTNGITHTDENGTAITSAANANQFLYALDNEGNYIIKPSDYNSARKFNHIVELYDPKNPGSNGQKLTLTDLNGSIGITSTAPSNYAIRYIILKVYNAELSDEPQYVVIAHYPPIYVTHVIGWYSYREDFGGTTWQTLCNSETVTYSPTTSDTGTQSYLNSSTTFNNWRCGCTWSRNDEWTYGTSETGFFGSKIYVNNFISYARWNKRQGYTQYRRAEENQMTSLNNPRMYHIQAAASNKKYTFAVPRLTNGVTDPNPDNQELVSPSFMVASQLGATMTLDTDKTGRLKQGADHCKQYVETYKITSGSETKVIHLDDWRLPTQAEIQFILDAQYTPNSPMATVLTGSNYLAADGEWGNNSSGSGNNALRCVRDAYKTPDSRTMPVVGSSEYDSSN